jgi:PIN domain nuclease of toxin-antitoxin system
LKLLLDTHAFLWFVAGNKQLSKGARRRIEDVRHEKLLSVASIWEIAIKASLGKLTLSLTVDELVVQGASNNGIAILPVLAKHASRVASLPFHHRDPFDRLLVAQALTEGYAVLSRDESLEAYGVRLMW